MKTVETGQHEKRGPIGSGGELEVHLRVGMAVFVSLQAHKQEPQGEREEQP